MQVPFNRFDRNRRPVTDVKKFELLADHHRPVPVGTAIDIRNVNSVAAGSGLIKQQSNKSPLPVYI